MNKIILFSHENDIDGMGSVILSKLAFGDIDYVLASNVSVLESKFREMLNNKKIYDYDQIYITDLALYNPSLDIVINDDRLNNKIKVFDHHQSSITAGCAKNNFTKVVEEENGLKTCATMLFYNYLVENNYIEKSKVLDDYCYLTRLEDTWEWKDNGQFGIKAHDLAILFDEIGYAKYIDSMVTKLSNNNLDFTAEEINLLNNAKEKTQKELDSIWNETVFLKDQDGFDFLACYADYKYRNILPEYAKEHNSNLKYVVLVALEKGEYGQRSYRSVDPTFDVGKIAIAHGGMGHITASSVNITKYQKEHALELKNDNLKESLEYIVNSVYAK